jgi:hypothetical protein
MFANIYFYTSVISWKKFLYVGTNISTLCRILKIMMLDKVYKIPSGKIEKETQGREHKPVLLSCVLHTVCLGMGGGGVRNQARLNGA